MNYWTKKNEMKRKAVEHTKEMMETHKDKIKHSIEATRTYGPEMGLVNHEEHPVEMIVEQADSVLAVLTHAKEGVRPAVANFASYKNPGGMFIEGSKAQEECLCHESTLYNVLSHCPSYYKWNNLHKNKALYENRALFSEDIVFERDGQIQLCSVLTCAAPNYSAASKYMNIDPAENSEVLRKRISFIKKVLEAEGVDVFIFGAFGCGVFGQNPAEVAKISKEVFATSSTIKRVYFSIIDEKTTLAFRNVI